MTIDYRERWEDREEALLAALDAFSARTWCSGPGFVERVKLNDSDHPQTCDVQPAIMGRVQASDGTYTWVKLPLLVDCPVIFLRGGGFAVTVPLQVDDEVTVFFADKCIDGWWSSGQVSPQSEIRFHDLSDGFVLPGPASKGRAIPNISTTALQIRSDDGATHIELTPGQQVNVVAPGGINLNGVTIDAAGNTDFGGATVKQGGKHIDSTHFHSGVVPGGSDTDPVAGP